MQIRVSSKSYSTNVDTSAAALRVIRPMKTGLKSWPQLTGSCDMNSPELTGNKSTQLHASVLRLTTSLAAAKLGRLVLSQFVRCEQFHRNIHVQNWSSVQFMGFELTFKNSDRK